MLRKPWVQEIEAKLGPRMWRRLRVALSTPLFIASTIAIFMFIGSTEEVLYVYVDRCVVKRATRFLEKLTPYVHWSLVLDSKQKSPRSDCRF